MAQSRDRGRLPGRALGGVDPRCLPAGVDDEWPLGRQRGQLMQTGDDGHRGAAGIDQADPHPADTLRQRVYRHARLVGQSPHVGLVAGAQRQAAEP